MKTFVNIFIADSNIFRRFWMKRAVKKITDQSATTFDSIRTCKTLIEVKERLASSGSNNMYFLRVDLNSEKDLADLKKIREKDRLGNLVLFVKNVENLGILFKKQIVVLDYKEINSSKQEQIEKIRETYEYVMSRRK